MTSGPSIPRAAASHRLTRRRRLVKPGQFDAVFGARRRRADPLFVVFVRANGLPFGRLGLAVSRKVSRRATERNRIKRTIRESFRDQLHRLAGLDVVVVARPPAAAAAGMGLRQSLQGHWDKLT